MLQPSSGTWQVPQCRPLVPCGVKKSLLRSTKPAVWNDASRPALLCSGLLLGISECRSASRACWSMLSSSSGSGSAHAAMVASEHSDDKADMYFINVTDLLIESTLDDSCTAMHQVF